MNRVVLDLETNGLPQTQGWGNYYYPKESKWYDTSRVVQIGYIVIDKDHKVVKKVCNLIKPDGFTIENAHIHGITYENAVDKGIPIVDALKELEKDFQDCSHIISHNVKFDYNVLLSECYRYNMTTLCTLLEGKKTFCTMEIGRIHMGVRKYPKLTEMYERFFPNDKWEQIHDALDDCEHCLKCYIKIQERRAILN